MVPLELVLRQVFREMLLRVVMENPVVASLDQSKHAFGRVRVGLIPNVLASTVGNFLVACEILAESRICGQLIGHDRRTLVNGLADRTLERLRVNPLDGHHSCTSSTLHESYHGRLFGSPTPFALALVARLAANVSLVHFHRTLELFRRVGL